VTYRQGRGQALAEMHEGPASSWEAGPSLVIYPGLDTVDPAGVRRPDVVRTAARLTW